MKLFKTGNKFYLDFRFRDKRFRLIAFETEKTSQSLAHTIERLIDIYYANDVISLDLQRAVDCLPLRIVRKLENAGLLSTARSAGKNRLADYLSGFIGSLKIRRDTDEHLRRVENRIKSICKKCKFDCLSDLDAVQFTAYINGLTVAAKTKRDLIATFKQFANYLSETGLLPKNNFKLIKTPKVLQADQRHARRALTADEVARLIAAAGTGKSFRGISGAERALIYRLAVESGLRYNEIKTLKVSDFDFVDNTVEVRDENEKARRGAILPLRKTTAGMIKDFLRNKTPPSPAFVLKKGWLMIQADLTAADIPYRDDSGRYADFHSLRHTACSLMIATGANVKAIQTLMRHSTADLTLSKYSHIYAGQQRQTIENLPDFDSIRQDATKKTGTYDTAENQVKENWPKSAHESAQNMTKRDNSSGIIISENDGFEALNSDETAFSDDKQASDFSEGKWRRGDSNPRPETFQNRLLHV